MSASRRAGGLLGGLVPIAMWLLLWVAVVQAVLLPLGRMLGPGPHDSGSERHARRVPQVPELGRLSARE